MENKILNTLFIGIAGIIGAKFVRATIDYKKQLKEHEEVLEDSDND